MRDNFFTTIVLISALAMTGCSSKMFLRGNTVIYPGGYTFEVAPSFENKIEKVGLQSTNAGLFGPKHDDDRYKLDILQIRRQVTSQKVTKQMSTGWDKDKFFISNGMKCGEFYVYYVGTNVRYSMEYCVDGFLHDNLTNQDIRDRFNSVVKQSAP